MNDARKQPGLTALLYRFAWRFKNIAHAFLPHATRQRIQDWMFRRWVARVPPPHRELTLEPAGINVIGYLRAELGVGEAARATLRAAAAADVPASVVERRQGSESRQEEAIPAGATAGLKYPVNVWHVNPDQFPYATQELSLEDRNSRYNIGYWNWELPGFPRAWRDSIRHVDEIWVPSKFCEDAIRPHTSKPVTRIPYALDPLPAGPVTRRDFSWRDDEFIFLFVFDVLSIVERKNPLGLIEAYRRARSALPARCRLVLKVINSQSDPAAMARVRAAAAEEPSVSIIDRYLQRAELNGLFRCSDAYVSLHRSEGFGFTMAEAMSIGKPVIATGWSANVDFMTQANSRLVRHRLVSLDRDYGPYRRGSRWAEPDLDDAAAGLVEIATDPAARDRLGTAAADDIRRLLSPRAVGQQIAARLSAIREEAGNRGPG